MNDVLYALRVRDVHPNENIGGLDLKKGLLDNSPMVPNPDFKTGLDGTGPK